MNKTRASKALSIFLTITLLFSNNVFSNSALYAFADEENQSQNTAESSTESTETSKEITSESASSTEAASSSTQASSTSTIDSQDSEDQSSNSTEASQDEAETSQNNSETSASADPEKDEVRAAKDITSDTDVLKLAAKNIQYTTAEGTKKALDAVLSVNGTNYTIDLTQASDFEAAGEIAVNFIAELKDAWVEGDTIAIKTPSAFSVDAEKLASWVQKQTAVKTAVAEKSDETTTTTFTLAGPADDQTEATIDLQIPLTLAEGVLGEEVTSAKIILTNSSNLEIKLPAKAADEEKSEDESSDVKNGVAAISEADESDDAASISITYDANASMTKTWYDGSDASRPVDSMKNVLKIYYQVEGESGWSEYNQTVAEILGASSVPEITTTSTANPYQYTAMGLPSTLSSGKKINYIISETNGALGTTTKVSLGGSTYFAEVSADGKTVNNVATKNFSFTLKDHNGGTDWAPTSDELATLLHVTTNDGTAVSVSASDITITKNDDGTWTVNVANLPKYSSSSTLGAEIGYKATLDDYTVGAGSAAGDAGDTYQAEYNNAAVPNYGSDTLAVHEGGTIDYIRKNTTIYKGTKVWLDGLSESASDDAKNQRPDTTFILWRYVNDGSSNFRNAATVLDNSGSPVTVTVDKTLNTFDFQIEGYGNVSLPKYNADGYEYIYFVRESTGSSELGNYKQVFGAYDDAGGLTDTLPKGVSERADGDVSIYNGGTINNQLSGTVNTTVTKKWVASAHQGYLQNYKTVMVLQARHVAYGEEGNKQEWYYCDSNGDDAEGDTSAYRYANLFGFASEITTLTETESMPKYDLQGYELEYRWVEVNVAQNDTPFTDASTQGHENDVDYSAGTDDESTTGDTTTYTKTGEVKTKYNAVSTGDRQDEDYYEVTSVTVDGATITTNKLVGKEDYKVTKKWVDANGDPIDVPENATAGYTLYKDNEEVASVTVKGSQTVTDAELDDNGGTKIGTYSVESSSNKGEQVITFKDLAKYNDDGTLVSYYVAESFNPTADGVQYVPSYEYDNDTRSATITNKPGVEGTTIRVQKKWLDDSDTSHRLPVTFKVSYKETSEVDGVSTTEDKSIEVTVNESSNWWKLVGLGQNTISDIAVEEEYITDTTGEKFSVQTSGNTKIVETKVGGKESEGHKYVVVDEGNIGTIGGYATYESTNRRVGTVNLTVEKTWNDTGADKTNRPEANAVLSITSGGATLGDNYVELTTETNVKHYIIGSTDGSEPSTDDVTDASGKTVVSTTQSLRSATNDTLKVYFYGLPKYDMEGKVISYSIDEQMTKEAANADYTSSISAGSYQIGSVRHTVDKQVYSATNSRSASTNLKIYKIWKDAYQKQLGHRSDLTLTIWETFQNADGSTTVEKYRVYGFKDYTWSPAGDGKDANYMQAKFNDLPKYTSDGAEITYYFEETYNNPKATTDYDYNNVNYDGDTIYLDANENVVQDKDSAAHVLLKTDGTFENGISNTVTVQGEKLWKNIPSGIRSLINLPNIDIKVYQQVTGSTSKVLVATLNSSTATGVVATGDTAGVNGFINGLDKGTNSWSFVAYYYDSTNEAGVDAGTALPKYDAEGNLYLYTIDESINATNGTSSDTWGIIYNENSSDFTASNEYNDENYTGEVDVTKTWDRSSLNLSDDENKYPVITFKLHQIFKASDGSFVQVKTYTEKLDANSTAPTDDKNTVLFTNLPVFAPDGSKYLYYLTEDSVNGYETTITPGTNTAATSDQYRGNDLYELNVTTGSDGKLEKGDALTFDVTNKYVNENISLAIKKVWNDGDNAAGIRPSTITVDLYRYADSQSGANNAIPKEELNVPFTLGSNGTWETNTGDYLQKWAPNGMPWKYEVKETSVPEGYKVTYSGAVAGNASNPTLTITNNLTEKATFTKTWEDGNNAYNTRPAWLKVKLQVAKSTTEISDLSTISDNSNDGWHDAKDAPDLDAELKNLLCKQFTGNTDSCQKFINGTTASASNLPSEAEINDTKYYLYYRIVEDVTYNNDKAYPMGNSSNSTDGESYYRDYIRTVNDTTYNSSTNTFVNKTTNHLETTTLTITKTWSDVENYWGKRPASVTYDLYYSTDNGATWTDSGHDYVLKADWTATVTGLPLCNASGNVYQWKAVEKAITSYEQTTSSDTFDSSNNTSASSMTNTLKTTSLKLEKFGGDTTNALKNVKFNVSAPNGKSFTWSTDDNGVASGSGDAVESGQVSVARDGTISGLSAGTYTFSEVRSDSANPTYAQNLSFKVTISADASTITTSEVKNGTLVTESNGTFGIKAVDNLATVAVTVNKVVKDGSSTPALANAKFELYKKAVGESDYTKQDGTLTSDSKGQINLGSLGVGDYYLQEIEVPANVVLTSDKFYFEVTNVDGGKVAKTTQSPSTMSVDGSTVTIQNEKFGASIAFKKVDSLNTNPISGAEFALYYSEDGKTFTKLKDVTSADGGSEYSASDLPKGSYELVETKAPQGFTVSALDNKYEGSDPVVGTFNITNVDNGKTIAVTTNSGTANVVNDDRILGKLVVTKTDDDGKVLAGTQFKLQVKNDNGEYVDYQYGAIKTTGEDGTITWSDLPWGTYKVTECAPTSGYKLNETNTKEFTVGADTQEFGGSDFTFKNTKTSISINKINNDDELVAGASLELLDGDTSVRTWTSTTSGETFEGLEINKTYTLKETTRLAGYRDATSTSIQFKLDDEGKIILVSGEDVAKVSSDSLAINFINTVVVANFEFDKVDGTDGNLLMGAEFTLKGKSARGYELNKVRTGGRIEFDNVPEGTYTLSETVTPEGYKTADDITVVVDGAGNVTFDGEAVKANETTVKNERILGEVEVTKTTADGKALAGTQFMLEVVNDDGLGFPYSTEGHEDGIWTTDSEGKITITDLPWGDYRISEYKATDGYILNPANTQDFMVEAGDSTHQKFTYDFKNEATDVKISKVDENGKQISGAKLEIKDADGNVVESWESSDSEAHEINATLATDVEYTLDESSRLSGYYELENPVKFKLDDEGKLVIVEDSDSVATITAEGLSLTLKNTEVTSDFSFTKTLSINEDCADDPSATEALKGAEFELKGTSALGAEIDLTATSDDAGKVSFTGVPEGTYTLSETKAPYDYLILAKDVQVKVDGAGKVTFDGDEVTSDTTINNEREKSDFDFNKVSEIDSKELPGATYQIERIGEMVDGKIVDLKTPQVVAKAESGSDGKVAFDGLLTNYVYKITEIVAPDGSLLSKNPITIKYDSTKDKFVLQDAGAITIDGTSYPTAKDDGNGNIVWNEPQTEYNFDKLDVDGNKLSGAKLEIQDANGKTVDSWTTDGELHSVKGVLVAGKTYKLVETEAPSGYEIAAPIEFTVEDAAVAPGREHTQTIVMIDEKTPETPETPGTPGNPTNPNSNTSKKTTTTSRIAKTGDELGWVVAGLCATAVVAAGTIGVVLYRRKRK